MVELETLVTLTSHHTMQDIKTSILDGIPLLVGVLAMAFYTSHLFNLGA